MAFLPTDYEVPQSGNYMKFVVGKNRFRVLGSAIVGNEFWRSKPDGTREPVRRRMNEPILANELEFNQQNNKPEPIKHFWAFPVWNYTAKAVQILEITQKGVMQSIRALAEEADWGDPQGYDIIVSKTGSGLDTEYAVQPAPSKPLTAEIETARDATPVNLDALFVNGDPFASGAPAAPIQEPKKAAQNIGDAGIAASKEQALLAFRAAHEGESSNEKNLAWAKLVSATVLGKPSKDFTASDWQRVRLAATPLDDSPFNDADENLAAVADALKI